MTKYLQVVAWLKGQIAKGGLMPGDRLPTEAELGERFGISRQTVRQALGMLENEGIVERRRGSGTYVQENTGNAAPDLSRRIGVMSTYIDDYIFPGLSRGIERVLRKHNYAMQVTFTYNRVEQERQALALYLDSTVDGIIIEPVKCALPNSNLAPYQQIKALGIPVLFFDAFCPPLDIPYVSLAARAAGP